MIGGAKEIMKTSKKIIFSIALIFVIMLITMNTTVMAVDTSRYDPTPQVTAGAFTQRAGIVLGWIKYIGILISVIALTIIGIKYLFSSVENKAEYKKTMVPYVIGCFMLAGVSIVISLIESIAKV